MANWQDQVLGEFPVSVYYEDTDFTGFVFHANYLKYFDRAREHLMGACRLRQLYALGKHFVVRKAELTYERPAKYGDSLTIQTSALCTQSPLLHFQQVALLEHEGKLVQAVTAQIQVVTVNQRGFPTRTPQEIVAHIESLTNEP